MSKGAVGNIVGGQATGGNDPTAGVIVRPPQGNLISGNRGNGVLITKGATQTLLSGNFVGTAASGDSALGNKQDGVAIVKANNNELIGCTFQQSPFVFYNVLSGNGGNGLASPIPTTRPFKPISWERGLTIRQRWGTTEMGC